MMGHNICFKGVIWKVIPKFPFYSFLSGRLGVPIHILKMKIFFFVLKGNNPTSGLEKEIGSVQLPANEHYFGLVNVSLICFLYDNFNPF